VILNSFLHLPVFKMVGECPLQLKTTSSARKGILHGGVLSQFVQKGETSSVQCPPRPFYRSMAKLSSCHGDSQSFSSVPLFLLPQSLSDLKGFEDCLFRLQL